MGVSATEQLLSGEGGHQQQQGRARQMEVGEQRVHGAKRIRRQDVLACPSRGRRELPPVRIAGGLERPDHRGPDRDAAASETSKYSSSMRCARGSAAVIGRKVPGPTWSNVRVLPTPRAARDRNSGSVKWSPAVGAAIAPSTLANTV